VLIRRRHQQGMSIVEILVALAIIGLLMGFLGPSAGVWIQNTQLRNAGDAVLTGIQQAKLEALKRNRLIMFKLTDANSTAWDICIYDYVTDACSAAADAIIASKSASEASGNARVGAEVAPTSYATALAPGAGIPATFTFDPFGRQAATAANNLTRIDVRNPTMSAADERRLVILVNAAGQIRMCDPKLNKATNPQGCQ
jgi:type IV fimbrial biogenesis protein FimT